MGPLVYTSGSLQVLQGTGERIYAASMGPLVYTSGSHKGDIYRFDGWKSFNGAAGLHQRKL